MFKDGKDNDEILLESIKTGMRALEAKRNDILIRLRRVEDLERETGHRNIAIVAKLKSDLNKVTKQLEVSELPLKNKLEQRRVARETLLGLERKKRQEYFDKYGNYPRRTRCWSCKRYLSEESNSKCARCRWILCSCGACGCPVSK